MECINRSIENNLLANAMMRKLEQAVQQAPSAAAFPEIREPRAQRRARERAAKKAHLRAIRVELINEVA